RIWPRGFLSPWTGTVQPRWWWGCITRGRRYRPTPWNRFSSHWCGAMQATRPEPAWAWASSSSERSPARMVVRSTWSRPPQARPSASVFRAAPGQRVRRPSGGCGGPEARLQGARGSARPNALRAPDALGQALEEIAQQLVPARAEVLVPRLAEQRRQLGLGYREPGTGEHLVHVHVLQLEGDPQLLQHHVVADPLFHRTRWQPLVAATQVHDQAVQEVRQHRVAASQVAGVVLLEQEGAHLIDIESEVRIRQVRDLDHLAVGQVEHVADAAQNVVVDHVVLPVLRLVAVERTRHPSPCSQHPAREAAGGQV